MGRSIDGSEAAPARFTAACNKECGTRNAKTEILGVIWVSGASAEFCEKLLRLLCSLHLSLGVAMTAVKEARK